MGVEYRDAEKWPAEMRRLVGKATDALRAVIGSGFDMANVVWEQVTDEKGHAVYVLAVSAAATYGGSATATFTPDEFQEDRHVRIRMYQLWGDVLQDSQELRKSVRPQPIAG